MTGAAREGEVVVEIGVARCYRLPRVNAPHDPRLSPPPRALVEALRAAYEIEAPIGRGGMATVYRARDLRHDRLVAIKLLDGDVGAALGAERFQREVRIAARLAHPNLLPVHDSGELDGELWYVMPFVADGSLRDRLAREGPLPVADVVAIARDVASALAYAHAQGVIHRDIKPENILFEAGRAVVADFGIARVLDPDGSGLTSSGGLAVGTPAYMSPEQATAHPQLDPRTDQYSLGVVMYEMLAGNAPFASSTPRAVLARHVHETPPPLRIVRPDLPPWLVAVVERALAKVPADRFSDLAVLDQALVAGPSGFHPPVLERRRRWAALAVLGAIAAAAWAATRPPPPDPRRVAVLPIERAAADRDLEGAAESITADLAGGLASVESLIVSPVSDVRPLARATAAEVRRVLNVRWLVTGRLTGSGDTVQLTADLVDTRDGRQVRSWKWRAAARTLLAVQDTASAEIARELRVRLGAELRATGRRAETRSVEAWELVQRAARRRREGRALVERDDPATARTQFAAAETLLLEARRKDPAWPEPLVEQGQLALELGRLVPPGDSAAAAAPARARALADSALKLRAGDQRALRLRGESEMSLFLLQGAGGDSTHLAAAERDLRGAAAGDGSEKPAALALLSQVERLRGNALQAHDLARRAFEADNYLENARDVLLRLCETSLEIDRPDEARRWCEEGRRRAGDEWLFLYYRLTQLVWQRGPAVTSATVWATYDTLVQTAPLQLRVLEPEWRLLAAAALARGGLADSARRVMREVLRKGEVHVDQRFYEAVALANLGDGAGAMRVLEDFLRRAPEMRSFVASSALTLPLRELPAFRVLVGR